MFCPECGKPAERKFCPHCGAPLTATELTKEVVLVEIVPDWDHEVRYETILKFPGVRDTIERHARRAPKRISGEQFLKLADNLVPLGVPLEGLVAVVQPLYERLGIKTGKQRSSHVQAPIGKVIVRTLCSLARNGQTLHGVTQAADGCLFEASLPSDIFSLSGNLLVSVRHSESSTEVCGATHIGGQLYDWGKSNRCLDKLFADVTSDAA